GAWKALRDRRETERVPPSFFRLAFSPDGKVLASWDNDDLKAAWDPATGRNLPPQKGDFTVPPEARRYTGGSYSRDGRWLAEQGTHDEIFVREAESNRVVCRVRLDGLLRATAVSPDGRLLAVADGDWGTVRLWDVKMAAPLHATAPGHLARTYFLTFSPDGRLLATTGL